MSEMVEQCRDCAYFRNDAAFLEKAVKGLISLGSAHGSARAEDGICLFHNSFRRAAAVCPKFTLAVAK